MTAKADSALNRRRLKNILGGSAGNLSALKVLVTNIQTDAEISGSNAVDLLQRAAYYLRNKGRVRVPTPFLVTHSLVNDPARAEGESPYVPLGPTETIEDPRLVRIGKHLRPPALVLQLDPVGQIEVTTGCDCC